MSYERDRGSADWSTGRNTNAGEAYGRSRVDPPRPSPSISGWRPSPSYGGSSRTSQPTSKPQMGFLVKLILGILALLGVGWAVGMFDDQKSNPQEPQS